MPGYSDVPIDAPLPTPLVPLEINDRQAWYSRSMHLAYCNSDTAGFIHSGWRHRRRRIRDALVAAGTKGNRMEAFCTCGQYAWLERSVEPEPRFRIRANWCRDRWCAVCATRRGREIAARLLSDRDPRNLRFVTLTLRILPAEDTNPGDPGSLKYALDRLYAGFRKLRTLPFWKGAVTGGAAFTELKWSTSSCGWNVHVHALIEGVYLPHPKLKAAWHKITGDSFVVEISKVKSTTRAVGYVTRYVTKAWDRATERQPERLREAIVTLGQRHLVTTFGAWRGKPLRVTLSTCEWETIEPLEDLWKRMESGDPGALDIWTALNLRNGILHLHEQATDTYDDT